MKNLENFNLLKEAISQKDNMIEKLKQDNKNSKTVKEQEKMENLEDSKLLKEAICQKNIMIEFK